MKYLFVLLAVIGAVCATESDPGSTYNVTLFIEPNTFGLGSLLKKSISSIIQAATKDVNHLLYKGVGDPGLQFPVKTLKLRLKSLKNPTFERVMNTAVALFDYDSSPIFKSLPILITQIPINIDAALKAFLAKLPADAECVPFAEAVEAAEAYFAPFLTNYLVAILNGHQ